MIQIFCCQVAKILIESGADPNLPLGKGVGTALCAITTTEAIKNHTLASSIAMVLLSACFVFFINF